MFRIQPLGLDLDLFASPSVAEFCCTAVEPCSRHKSFLRVQELGQSFYSWECTACSKGMSISRDVVQMMSVGTGIGFKAG